MFWFWQKKENSGNPFECKNVSVTFAESNPRLEDPDFISFQKQKEKENELKEKKEIEKIENDLRKTYKVWTEIFFEDDYDTLRKWKVIQIVSFKNQTRSCFHQEGFFLEFISQTGDEYFIIHSNKENVILVDKKAKWKE